MNKIKILGKEFEVGSVVEVVLKRIRHPEGASPTHKSERCCVGYIDEFNVVKTTICIKQFKCLESKSLMVPNYWGINEIKSITKLVYER